MKARSVIEAETARQWVKRNPPMRYRFYVSETGNAPVFAFTVTAVSVDEAVQKANELLDQMRDEYTDWVYVEDGSTAQEAQCATMLPQGEVTEANIQYIDDLPGPRQRR